MPSYARLLIASSKGGVGKSATAVGLAAAMAEEGKRVLLLDLDFTSRSLDLLLGCEDRALFDFADAADGMALADAAVHKAGGMDTLSLLPACSMERVYDAASIAPDAFIRNTVERILTEAEDAYDVCICDTGGGIEVAEAVADFFPMAVIPSEQSQTSVRAAEFAAHQLAVRGAKEMRLVICAFDLRAVKREKRAGMIEMIDASSLPCAGVVPFDRNLQKIQDGGGIPDRKSVAGMAYRNIAGRLAGEEIPLFTGMGWYYRRRQAALL